MPITVETIVRNREHAHQRMTDQDHWFRYWMPYTFTELKHPKHQHVYLPLNRNYKPLGYTSDFRVNYNDYLDQAVIFLRDPNSFQDIWWDRAGFYLYEDASTSRLDYFTRFERLMLQSVRLVAVAG